MLLVFLTSCLYTINIQGIQSVGFTLSWFFPFWIANFNKEAAADPIKLGHKSDLAYTNRQNTDRNKKKKKF